MESVNAAPPPDNQLDVSSIRQCNHFLVPLPGHLIRVICVIRFIILDSDQKMHVRSKHKANSLFHLIIHGANLDKHFEIKNHAEDERNGMCCILTRVSCPFYDGVGSADGYYPPEEHNLPNCMCHVMGGSAKGYTVSENKSKIAIMSYKKQLFVPPFMVETEAIFCFVDCLWFCWTLHLLFSCFCFLRGHAY